MHNSLMILLYRIMTFFIFIGFLMMCQPFHQGAFSAGFPVLLVGVAGFIILDHFPKREEQQVGEQTSSRM
jgi:hypothetical protein